MKSPEILVLGASSDGGKKVRAGGIGSCNLRGTFSGKAYVTGTILSASYILFYLTLHDVKKLRLKYSS